MPVRRKGEEQQDKGNVSDEVLKDNDEVFYCELSNAIFRNYDEYFEHIMLFNSTVWTCALTSRPNLTYAEALQSEKEARKSLKNFVYELKAPIVYTASLTKRARIADMVDDVYNYMNVRYVKEEEVFAMQKVGDKEIWRECEVLNVIGPTTDGSPGQVDPIAVSYRVKRIDTEKDEKPWIVTAKQIRRRRSNLNKEKLKLFLKQCVECNDSGLLTVKKSMYEKHVIDGGVRKFSDFFVGKPPIFTLAKQLVKKIEKVQQVSKKKDNKKLEKPKSTTPDSGKKKNKKKDDKQPEISNFFTKNNDDPVKKDKSEEKIEKAKINTIALRDQMEKRRIERELKKKKAAEEKERQRYELSMAVSAMTRTLNTHREDLELQDQKLLPAGRAVSTLIPKEYFGDSIAVLEFLYSFSNLLEDKDKFKGGYSLAVLERSLLHREFIGPLGDIIQVLLGSIFALQIEEENEVEINYSNTNFEFRTMEYVQKATLAANWSGAYHPLALPEMPMDATTISELLRIHLLMSGAKVNDECSRWRFQQRSGYTHEDDPGLMLRIKHSHILRALTTKTVYELPLKDVLTVLNCLICQILTYSSMRDVCEERLDLSQKAKFEMRKVCAAERKRTHAQLVEQREARKELKRKFDEFVGSEDEKKLFNEKLTKDEEERSRRADAVGERAKNTFKEQVLKNRKDIFSYQSLLGTDRAYRSYWLFESLPGLFIEHHPRGGQCIVEPVKNIPELAQSTAADRYQIIKKMVMDKMKANDKENTVINGTVVNGIDEATAGGKEVITALVVSQGELLMCTGSVETCPVHAKSDGSVWSYLNTAEELDELIQSLNSRGLRERALKDELEAERDLILDHIKDCPVEQLQVNDTNREARLKALIEKKYNSRATDFPEGTEISMIAETQLIDAILYLEGQVTRGNLGSLKVNDIDDWRTALLTRSYDMQCVGLKWGPENQFTEGKIKQNGISIKDRLVYADPATDLENDVIEEVSNAETAQKIHNYASALLQIAQSIDQVFFKPPFGILREIKDTAQMETWLADGRKRFEHWTVLLMNSTSYSQVFLHLNIFNDAIKWTKSSLNATCIFCRGRSQPDKMLLCDGCNCGKHIFCFKPKLTKVPAEDWFCEKCKPLKKESKKKTNNRKIFSISEDEGVSDDNEVEDVQEISATGPIFYKNVYDGNESDFLEDCAKCDKPGRVMATCNSCPDSYHLACVRPVLKSVPNTRWQCTTCKRQKKPIVKTSVVPKFAQYQAQANEHDTVSDELEDEEEEEEDIVPVPKKIRPVAAKKAQKVAKEEEIFLEDEDEDEEPSDDDLDMSYYEAPTKPKLNGRTTRKKHRKTSSEDDDSIDNEKQDEEEELSGKHSRNAKKSRRSINSDDDDDFEERAAKKSRSSSSSKKRSRRALTDSDDEQPLKKRNRGDKSNSSIRRSDRRRKPSKKSAQNLRKSSSSRKSSRRVARYLDDSDDEETSNVENDEEVEEDVEDEDDDIPLQRKSGSSRRSRLHDDNDDPDNLLDTVVCYDLLAEIAKHEDSWPFERPVNKMEVPDYYDVIETPMDFAKIKSKLNLGAYRTMYDIMNDIQLIFSNCDRYNNNGTYIYNAGVSLERFIQARCTALKIPFKPSDMIASEPHAGNSKH